MFTPSIESLDGAIGYGPGHANQITLDRYFSVLDAGQDQFDGALRLSVTQGGVESVFPEDQSYDELTAVAPFVSEAEGLMAVTFPTGGLWANRAVLHPGRGVRLQQTLDLRQSSGSSIRLAWSGTHGLGDRAFLEEPAYCQVVLRDAAGGLLDTLYRVDSFGEVTGTWGQAPLTAHAETMVVLSFELESSAGLMSVAEVSARDTGRGIEYVANGEFANNGAGWVVPSRLACPGVLSAARKLGDLSVRRTFYCHPTAPWVRMTDEFVNDTSTSVAARVAYSTGMGSMGYGVVYPTPGAQSSALTSWDGARSDGDWGIVFGAADGLTYQSASAVETRDGLDHVQYGFSFAVPPKDQVSIVNFLVLPGICTGRAAADTSIRASLVDEIARDIATNFRVKPVFRAGLTSMQLNTLRNL